MYVSRVGLVNAGLKGGSRRNYAAKLAILFKIWGDAESAYGVLLLIAGKDWGTNEQRARSMRAFMTQAARRLAGREPT